MMPIEISEIRYDFTRLERAMKRFIENSWYGMLTDPLGTSVSIVPRAMQKTNYSRLIAISNPPDTNVTLDGVCHWIFIRFMGRYYYTITALTNLHGTMWRDPPIVVIKTSQSNWDLIKDVRLPKRMYNHYAFGMYGKEIYDNESKEKRRAFDGKIKKAGKSKNR